MSSCWILTLAVLDGNDVAKTLYFTDGAYIDDDANFYETRIATPAIVNISPNDGGLLGIFDSASVGNVELENKDGGLDYLAGYAIDGRAAVLSWVDGDTVTEYYRGVVTKMSESGGRITLSLKSPHEVLNDDFPMAIYAGTNTGYIGLEGTDADIKDAVKTQIFGDCRNIPATLVNAALLIYQVSSRNDCIITAVYDDGVRLVNYQTSAAYSIGATTIAIDSGIGDIPVGSQVKFANHSIIYSVQTGLSNGVIVLASGLTVAVPNNTAVEVINFYEDTTELQATDYQVNGSHAVNAKTIAIYNGVGVLNQGDLLVFSNQQVIYTVADATASHVTLSNGLITALNGNEFVHVVTDSPALWGGYQGYFRLATSPLGTITCDAVSMAGGLVRKTGEICSDLATAVGLTVDGNSVTELNGAGAIGLYVDAQTSISDLFDRIMRSVGAFYHILNGIIYANLLLPPTNSPVFTVEDYQINRIDRIATGLGSNGLPLKGVHALYDRIETVQDSLAGGVTEAWRERLKKQYRELTTTDAAVATRHPLALLLEVESLLRGLALINVLTTRLLSVVKVRRDVVSLEVQFTELPQFLLADTMRIVTRRLGYSASRNFVIIGYSIDMKSKTMTLKVFG
jgi:hypothetical protein